MQEEAAKVLKNETKPSVTGTDGVERVVEDAGGREHARAIVLDIHQCARDLKKHRRTDACGRGPRHPP